MRRFGAVCCRWHVAVLAVLFACSLMSLFCLHHKLIALCVVLAPSTVASFMWARRYSAAMLLLFRHVTCVSLIPCPCARGLTVGPGARVLVDCPCARDLAVCPWIARVPVCPCVVSRPISTDATLTKFFEGTFLESVSCACTCLGCVTPRYRCTCQVSACQNMRSQKLVPFLCSPLPTHTYFPPFTLPSQVFQTHSFKPAQQMKAPQLSCLEADPVQWAVSSRSCYNGNPSKDCKEPRVNNV